MKKISIGGNIEYTLLEDMIIGKNQLAKGTKFWVGYWGYPYMMFGTQQGLQLTQKNIATLNKMLNSATLDEKIN